MARFDEHKYSSVPRRYRTRGGSACVIMNKKYMLVRVNMKTRKDTHTSRRHINSSVDSRSSVSRPKKNESEKMFDRQSCGSGGAFFTSIF